MYLLMHLFIDSILLPTREPKHLYDKAYFLPFTKMHPTFEFKGISFFKTVTNGLSIEIVSHTLHVDQQ